MSIGFRFAAIIFLNSVLPRSFPDGLASARHDPSVEA